MASDDWRLRLELEEEGRATDFLARLGLDLGTEARELAKDLKKHRLAVSNDADSVFVYGASREAIERARPIVEAELRDLDEQPREIVVEHWLHEEERWSDEAPPPETDEEELLDEGYAPWEVRVQCDSVNNARALADRLEQEGYGVVRRFRYVIAGTASEEEARALAERVHGDVEAGGELAYEAMPQNPFIVFGGLGV